MPTDPASADRSSTTAAREGGPGVSPAVASVLARAVEARRALAVQGPDDAEAPGPASAIGATPRVRGPQRLDFVPTQRRPVEDGPVFAQPTWRAGSVRRWQADPVAQPLTRRREPRPLAPVHAAAWEAPGPGRPDAPPQPSRATRRRPGWIAVVGALTAVALMVAAPQVSQLVRAWGDPADLLGPDLSTLVTVADPADLPVPTTSGSDVPSGVFEASQERLRPPVEPPVTDAPHAFLYSEVAADGASSPVTWSPCLPMHVTLNPANGPADAEPQLIAALGALSAATGLQIVYDGTTDEPVGVAREPFQPERYGDRWAPVLVGFASAAVETQLEGEVAGLGGPVLLTRGDGVGRTLVSGAVTIDTAVLGQPRNHGVDPWLGVLRHELGHIAGLAHVDDPTQLMYPETRRVASFQDGDLAGLARLGAGQCAPSD